MRGGEGDLEQVRIKFEQILATKLPMRTLERSSDSSEGLKAHRGADVIPCHLIKGRRVGE